LISTAGGFDLDLQEMLFLVLVIKKLRPLFFPQTDTIGTKPAQTETYQLSRKKASHDQMKAGKTNNQKE